jgi:predicted Zn-dependent protease
MADPDRRPTAQEIEELIDLVRRDPSSPAFIDLGEAYLNLGRPKDAISVGNHGLQASPDNLEGRVMLARAFCALHQWKEAQGELLRVVKVDRSSRNGFALLGEVLLRRNDYERAVPVLQHAQNLDPTSPQILQMLKRARAGQPLDPPAPVPSPVPPRGETNYALQLEQAARPQPSPPPARPVAPSPSRGMQAQPMAQSSPVAPTMALQPGADAWGAQPGGTPSPRGSKQTAPPPMSVEGVRPRVISGAKPQNAAAASLRQSAAVGENYLNDLLTGGLLDVAGVRVPDADYDLRPDRRWGRSTRRAFIFLFVVLVFGVGGGGFWYYWTERQKAEAVAKLQKGAKTAEVAGDYDGLQTAIDQLSQASAKDGKNQLTTAYHAEAAGIAELLYGIEGDRAEAAIARSEHDLKAGDPGSRELLIGKAARDLSRLPTLDAAGTTLADTKKALDDYLGAAGSGDDRWARWLKGRALLAAGERTAAKAVFKQAGDGDDGLVLAMIDQADLLADNGSLDEAFALYDKALAKAKDHPLAVLGKSLARAESNVQANDAIDDLNVKLDKKLGPRVAAYRDLALALADIGIEDYPKSGELLTKATAHLPDESGKERWKDKGLIWPAEPRFLARVAWLHYVRGEIKLAERVRSSIAWYGKGHPEDDPSVMLVDAALAMAEGSPEKVLDITSKLDGVRPHLLRAYAELDLGKAKDALADMDTVLKKSPDNIEAQIIREEAHMIASDGKERAAAADALEKLARKAKSKLGRHALGMAYLAVGNTKEAQSQLEQALADLTDESPNPLAYRTHTALAKILLANNDVDGARKQLDQALDANKGNSGYTPSRVLQAKVVLKAGDAKLALDLLQPLFKDNVGITPDVQLTLAEALCTYKDSGDQGHADAKAQLEQIKDKIQPVEEVGRVAALCDPKLPAELGVPAPAGGAAPKSSGGGGHHHHH